MSKDGAGKSSNFGQSREFPYSRGSNNVDSSRSKIQLPPTGNEKEWEEARCPVCMDHPHNAVLLLCSSHDKGCRPFMCDTSRRHSNCLDQFRKSSEDVVPENLKLVCPLCRGRISGWVVITPAREYMNFKHRSCSLETCDFSGNYSELRRHARLEHPNVQPSRPDPSRQHEWEELEQEYEYVDFDSDVDEEYDDEDLDSAVDQTVDIHVRPLRESRHMPEVNHNYSSRSRDHDMRYRHETVNVITYAPWYDEHVSHSPLIALVPVLPIPTFTIEPTFTMVEIVGSAQSYGRRPIRSRERHNARATRPSGNRISGDPGRVDFGRSGMSRARYHIDNVPAVRRGSNSTAGEYPYANSGRWRPNSNR